MNAVQIIVLYNVSEEWCNIQRKKQIIKLLLNY